MAAWYVPVRVTSCSTAQHTVHKYAHALPHTLYDFVTPHPDTIHAACKLALKSLVHCGAHSKSTSAHRQSITDSIDTSRGSASLRCRTSSWKGSMVTTSTPASFNWQVCRAVQACDFWSSTHGLIVSVTLPCKLKLLLFRNPHTTSRLRHQNRRVHWQGQYNGGSMGLTICAEQGRGSSSTQRTCSMFCWCCSMP